MMAQSCYRRRVIVQIRNDCIEAGIEDDFHHFRVSLDHDGNAVTAIKGEAVRFPWVTCPGASLMLNRLVGATIRPDAVRRANDFDRFNQCTHQLELALLAIAGAARGNSRRYDVAITDPDRLNVQQALVLQDGKLVEEWNLREGVIMTPSELVGRDVRALRPWLDALDDERYERIAILRRCLQVDSGRLKKIRPNVASDVVGARNACFAFQDERAASGYFIRESVRDYANAPQLLLNEFQ